MTITVTWLVAHSCSTFHRVLQFMQTAHGLRHWVCRNRSDAEIFCWTQEKQEQLTVLSLSWSTQSSRSMFEIGTLFHMSRTSNIANLQFKWLQELIDIHFPETGIIAVGITGPSTYFDYQKLHRLVPSTRSPIRGRNSMWKGSCFAGHVMRNPLVSNHWLGTDICVHFVLVPPWFSILDTSSNTHFGLERLQTSGYVLSSHLTSPASTSNVSSIRAPTSAADTILPPAVTSGASDVIHGLKHRSRPSPQSLLYIKWWTSGRHELTWLWFYVAFSTIAVVVIIKQTCFYFSLTLWCHWRSRQLSRAHPTHHSTHFWWSTALRKLS